MESAYCECVHAFILPSRGANVERMREYSCNRSRTGLCVLGQHLQYESTTVSISRENPVRFTYCHIVTPHVRGVPVRYAVAEAVYYS